MSDFRTLYLVKASDDVVSHCRCDRAYVARPRQGDCPWCGCGWLFTCQSCRMAFTFARAVYVDIALEDLVRNDRMNGGEPTSSIEEVEEWVEAMEDLLSEVVPGETYVYLDGLILPVDAGGVEADGLFARHDLRVVPQAEARRDPSILTDLLRDPGYWLENRIEDPLAGEDDEDGEEEPA